MDPTQPLAEGLAPAFAIFWRWFVPVFLLGVGLKVLLGSFLKGMVGERQVARVLERVAMDVRNDVLVPDGGGGLTQVDHLVLAPDGIWVIETKNYGGSIFGGEREKSWTQKMGSKRFRFRNPLRQNYGHIKAIEAALPDTPVHGRVVFSDRARFPKGMPQGVIQVGNLERELGLVFGSEAVPRDLKVKWEALEHRIRSGRDARKAHLAGIEKSFAENLRRVFAYGLIGAGLALFVGARMVF